MGPEGWPDMRDSASHSSRIPVEREIRCQGDPSLEPVYQSAGASGADLKAFLPEPLTIKPGDRALISTGLAIEIPEGLEAQIRPRSGLAARSGVTVLNAPGTVDADYRGEIKVILVNLGHEDFVIRPGDRIAQIVFAPVVRVRFAFGNNVAATARGEDGFGSTGI
jgi:dUTP pyrophosphatase